MVCVAMYTGCILPLWAQEGGVSLQARVSIDSLTQLLSHQLSPTQRVPVYLKLSELLRSTQPQTSLRYAQQALTIAIQVQDSLACADAHFRLSNAYLQMSELAQALEEHLKAQEYYQTHQDSIKIAYGYQQVAGIYGRLNETEQAIVYHNKALHLFEKYHIWVEVNHVKGNLAIAHGKLKHFATGLTYAQQALAYHRKINDSTRTAVNLYIIGTNYFEQGCYAEALPYFQQGLAIVSPTNDYRIYYLYRGIARVYFLQNYLDKAETYALLSLERIKKAADNSADKIQLKYAYGLLHKIYTRKKNYQKALACLEKANQVTEELNSFEKGKEVIRIQSAYALEKQKISIESLKKDKILQETALQQKRLQIILLVTGILFSLFVAGGYFRSAYIRKQNNLLLTRKNLEIQQQKESLENYAEEIYAINEELKMMNEQLDEKVRQRTAVLRLQNTRLIEYQFINAHKVRGPLARILGLVILIKDCEMPAYPNELLGLLERSAIELDTVIYEIKNVLDNGGDNHRDSAMSESYTLDPIEPKI